MVLWRNKYLLIQWIMPFISVPEAIDEIRAGRILVVVDDEDRENEGDKQNVEHPGDIQGGQ